MPVSRSKLKAMLAERASEVLDGQTVHHLFIAGHGENPYTGALSVMYGRPSRRLIAVTDDAIVIFAAPWNLAMRRAKPPSVIARLPRSTQLGTPRKTPWRALWWPLLTYGWIRLNGERLWVESRDSDELRRLDESASSV